MQALPNANRANPPRKDNPVPSIDFWIILDLVANRWQWLAIGGLIIGAAALMAAAKLVGPKFTATAQLLRYETPGASDFFKQDIPMSAETFAGLIQAPDLLRRVGKSRPADPPGNIRQANQS
jgi:capsular polysaccharide biosynthesis protein